MGSGTDSHLCAGHADFDRRLDEIVTAAGAGKWSEVKVAWDQFVDDLDQHMEYEEAAMFPEFVQERGDRADQVQVLLDDHAGLRGDMVVLREEVGRQALQRSSVDAFVSRLRAHALREDETIYAWLDERRGITRKRGA